MRGEANIRVRPRSRASDRHEPWAIVERGFVMEARGKKTERQQIRSLPTRGAGVVSSESFSKDGQDRK